MSDELLETKASGSNNRKWMNAYRALLSKLAVMERLPEPRTQDQEMYLKGFRDAADEFKNYALRRQK